MLLERCTANNVCYVVSIHMLLWLKSTSVSLCYYLILVRHLYDWCHRQSPNAITALTLRGQSCLLSDPALYLHKLVTNTDAAAATADGR